MISPHPPQFRQTNSSVQKGWTSMWRARRGSRFLAQSALQFPVHILLSFTLGQLKSNWLWPLHRLEELRVRVTVWWPSEVTVQGEARLQDKRRRPSACKIFEQPFFSYFYLSMPILIHRYAGHCLGRILATNTVALTSSFCSGWGLRFYWQDLTRSCAAWLQLSKGWKWLGWSSRQILCEIQVYREARKSQFQNEIQRRYNLTGLLYLWLFSEKIDRKKPIYVDFVKMTKDLHAGFPHVQHGEKIR